MKQKKTYQCNTCNQLIPSTAAHIQERSVSLITLTRYQGSIKLDHINQQSKSKLKARYCIPCSLKYFTEHTDKILVQKPLFN